MFSLLFYICIYNIHIYVDKVCLNDISLCYVLNGEPNSMYHTYICTCEARL